LLQIGISLLLALVALPVAAVVFVGSAVEVPAVSWLGIPVGVAVGVLMFWWWGAIAVRRLSTRGPVLLAKVVKPV
jgi:ABC-2 type transport system permease protein